MFSGKTKTGPGSLHADFKRLSPILCEQKEFVRVLQLFREMVAQFELCSFLVLAAI